MNNEEQKELMDHLKKPLLVICLLLFGILILVFGCLLQLIVILEVLKLQLK